MPSLQRLQDLLGDDGLEVVAVSVDERYSDIPPFVAEHGLRFLVLHDLGKRVSRRYEVFQFPETWIIRRDGTLASHIIGARDWAAPGSLDIFGACSGRHHARIRRRPEGMPVPCAEAIHLKIEESSQFLQANAVAQRVRQLILGAAPKVKTPSRRPTAIALAELKAGKLEVYDPREAAELLAEDSEDFSEEERAPPKRRGPASSRCSPRRRVVTRTSTPPPRKRPRPRRNRKPAPARPRR